MQTFGGFAKQVVYFAFCQQAAITQRAQQGQLSRLYAWCSWVDLVEEKP